MGVVVALVAPQPILIPLLILVFLPAWLVASRRSEAFYRFFWRMTPRDRERMYVAGLLGDRDAAKEVRGFGLADYLRARYRRLYDERLDELRRIARRQLWYSLAANLATGLVLGATLLLVALFERIRALLEERTVLLISHRFSSVRSADRIYVLEQGKVVEGGSHDELMALQGLYAELFTLQARAYLEPATPEER